MSSTVFFSRLLFPLFPREVREGSINAFHQRAEHFTTVITVHQRIILARAPLLPISSIAPAPPPFQRPDVGGVSTRSRNGTPTSKECVVNGQNTKATPPLPPPSLLHGNNTGPPGAPERMLVTKWDIGVCALANVSFSSSWRAEPKSRTKKIGSKTESNHDRIKSKRNRVKPEPSLKPKSNKQPSDRRYRR